MLPITPCRPQPQASPFSGSLWLSATTFPYTGRGHLCAIGPSLCAVLQADLDIILSLTILSNRRCGCPPMTCLSSWTHVNWPHTLGAVSCGLSHQSCCCEAETPQVTLHQPHFPTRRSSLSPLADWGPPTGPPLPGLHFLVDWEGNSPGERSCCSRPVLRC